MSFADVGPMKGQRLIGSRLARYARAHRWAPKTTFGCISIIKIGPLRGPCEVGPTISDDNDLLVLHYERPFAISPCITNIFHYIHFHVSYEIERERERDSFPARIPKFPSYKCVYIYFQNIRC